MKKTTLLFSLLFSVFAFSQIKFENGYFINNENQRFEALIKNIDWKNNPTTFSYKLKENDAVQTGTINTVKLFEIYNQSKYVSTSVNIDRSSSNLANMSLKREPDYKMEKLFLKKIVDGDASLYSYADGNLNRYFFEMKNGTIEQLVSKPFKLDLTTMGYNNDYKDQLRKNLICSNITSKEIENVAYQSKSLENIFIKHNQCNNPDYIATEKKSNYGQFKLNIRPRINFINAQIFDNNNRYLQEFEEKTSFGAGLEFEYILPFNKDKWAIIIEPTYQSYHSEIETEPFPGLGKRMHTIDYQSVQIPLGIRHYMYLNSQSRIFVNGQYVIDIPLKGTKETKLNTGSLYETLDLTAAPHFAFGIGFNYLQKYGAEFRYFTKKSVTTNYVNIPSEMNTISIILSYTFFKSK